MKLVKLLRRIFHKTPKLVPPPQALLITRPLKIPDILVGSDERLQSLPLNLTIAILLQAPMIKRFVKKKNIQF
jgi:hypothetical protein